jgi:glycerol-3-phosphate dehydrogenase (NAD(P)+)
MIEETHPRRIATAVLGAGNWGTTIAHLLATNGNAVRIYTRDAARRDEINERRTNRGAVPGLELAQGISAVADVAEALFGAELVFFVVPSQSFRDACRAAADALRPDHLVVHATKGLEMRTHLRMSEILLQETCVRQLGVLAGPNIAAEIARGLPAGTVVASAFPRVIDRARSALASPVLRVFAATDVQGVELCGALKNVVAIAAGMADELRVGDNAKAFLVTRGMAELTRLAFAMGAEASTMTGLAGIGDLMVTCASALSRNHRVGAALARGENLDDVVARLGMVAEGVYASSSAQALARVHGLDLPLFERIERVLSGELSASQALSELMSLPAGRDVPRLSKEPPWRTR